MHPCITTLCDRYRASLHVYERSVGFASCLVSRLGCHIVWQLSAADFKHPCLKLWALFYKASMPYPHSASSHPPAPKKAGLCLFVVVEVGRGCRIAVVGVAASCSDSVRPPSCILARPAQCEFAPPSTKKSRAMPV